MNDARDEFRLLRTTVEDALYLDENCPLCPGLMW